MGWDWLKVPGEGIFLEKRLIIPEREAHEKLAHIEMERLGIETVYIKWPPASQKQAVRLRT